MEKKNWVRPQATVEKFVANEYVAACGDNNVVYVFECNAGVKYHHYAIKDANGNVATIAGRLMNGNDDVNKRGTYYSPCWKDHQAPTNSSFISGYYLDDTSTKNYNEKIPVVIWTENNSNVHCTPKINMNWNCQEMCSREIP